MWNTIVNEPVGMESFPCQVPEISWAETEDEKNTPANSPVMNITMQVAFTIFINEKIRCKDKIYTKVTIFLIIKIKHYLILSESGNILFGCPCILLQFLLLSTTSIPNYIAFLKKTMILKKRIFNHWRRASIAVW